MTADIKKGRRLLLVTNKFLPTALRPINTRGVGLLSKNKCDKCSSSSFIAKGWPSAGHCQSHDNNIYVPTTDLANVIIYVHLPSIDLCCFGGLEKPLQKRYPNTSSKNQKSWTRFGSVTYLVNFSIDNGFKYLALKHLC